MVQFLADQAEGLRKLLGHDFVRILTLTSSGHGVGKSTMVLNLAAALANAGKHVLILDENPGKHNLTAMMGVKRAYDLMDVVRFGRSLDEVMIPGPDGVSILQASHGGSQALAALSELELDNLVSRMHDAARPVDLILVDAAAGHASRLLSPTLHTQEIVVVLSAEGITDAYAHIKMMNLNHGKRHFKVLVNRVRSEDEARAVFENMSKVARRFLAISLEFIGFVHQDDALRQASRARGAFLDAHPQSISSNCFRTIAESIARTPGTQHRHMNVGEIVQQLLQGGRLSAAEI